MLQNKVNIELAKVTDPTSMPDADKEDAVVVAINRDTRCTWDKNQVPWRICAKSGRSIAEQTEKQIFMRADAGRSTAQLWMPLMMYDSWR